jgi:hypothetical protein
MGHTFGLKKKRGFCAQTTGEKVLPETIIESKGSGGGGHFSIRNSDSILI